MVSLDSPEKNRDFAKSLETDRVLLSDPTRDTARAYGVLGLGGLFARRWTFYIDREGIVREIDKDVRVKSAGQDIARRLEALGYPTRDPGKPGRTGARPDAGLTES